MKILILNWRDIKNPTSGGAEILTHEIAKRWVLLGHEVTQISSLFPNAKREEEIDGVKIIRMGHPDARNILGSVHLLAFLYYQQKLNNKFDIVIDEAHGLPFFTPWYIHEKKVVLICEVAGELWQKIFGPFYGFIGREIEKFYLGSMYKNIDFLTISKSTRDDLIKDGVDEKRITVLPMGITVSPKLRVWEKEKEITLIFVGRLSKPKGVEDAIKALSFVKKQIPKAKLWVVGRGSQEYREYLETLKNNLNLKKDVVFFDFVSEEKKFELMSKAHILIHPSIREGFGLTVPEAGFVGTPVIAYNSPGVRDIIRHMKNGILLPDNSPKMIAQEVFSLMKDKRLYKELQSKAKQEAKKFRWDNTAKTALLCLERNLTI